MYGYYTIKEPSTRQQFKQQPRCRFGHASSTQISRSRVTFVILPATMEPHADCSFVRTVISFRRSRLALCDSNRRFCGPCRCLDISPINAQRAVLQGIYGACPHRLLSHITILLSRGSCHRQDNFQILILSPLRQISHTGNVT